MLFVFMSQPDYACNPHALYEYVKNNTEHETAWIIKKDEKYYELIRRGVRCAVYSTVEGNDLVNEADYVIVNSYTFPAIQKREGQIFVNLWHGSGVKAHDFYRHEMDDRRAKSLEELLDKIDLMCVQSLDDRFKLSSMLHFDLRRCYVTGQPRLDYVQTSQGYRNLEKLFGNRIKEYEHYIFFAPSFRANGSGHSGTIFSDNVFRLNDYSEKKFYEFLKKRKAAFIYKLHPIEQTAFAGRNFMPDENCFELTEQQLFEKDIRYDELLNAFDVMISDYSSIAYDYLPLDRPLIYLIPDFEEYMSERGFVFHNINLFMPGEKVFHFAQLLRALEEAFEHPEKYKKEREFVLAYRFDFRDDKAAERCYETIINYKKIPEKEKEERLEIRLPSSATLLQKWLPSEYEIIDSTNKIPDQYSLDVIQSDLSKKYLYITEEIPRELRKLTGCSSTEIKDIAYYHQVAVCKNVRICKIDGGVDYAIFSADHDISKYTGGRKRIGFAGTIDKRIYFAMVQCICEVFSDYDIVFTGEIFGGFPGWLQGFQNLRYVPASYEELPMLIRSFDVALLPFFGRHTKTVPKEYFQYLACGKQVVASDMEHLPDSPALYRSASIEEAVENIKTALQKKDDISIQERAKMLAKEYDWERIGEKIRKWI